MKRETREKLKRIAELYPQERLEKSKERWRRAWAGEKPIDRYPYMYSAIQVDYYDLVSTKEDRLNLFLDEFLIRGHIPDDFIPTLFPGCRQSTLPGVLGAPEIVCQGDYTCERIIKDAEDVFRLPEPKILPGTPAWDWIEMEKYFIEECDGAIPVHVCDMQGPFDAAAQIWGYEELFPSAYDDDGVYDTMMHKMMDAFYLLWEEQKKVCGELFVPTHLFGWSWVPENGPKATLSADSMAMISDNFFREYYEPYLREMAQRLGSLTVHSCGNFSAVVKSLSNMPEVYAVNAGQMSPQQLFSAGWNKDKMMIIDSVEYSDIAALSEYMRENGLRAEFRVRNPRDKDGKLVRFPKGEWTQAQFDQMMECTRKLNDWLHADRWK